MAEKVPSFQSGGALWFTDLTTPDSMLILPILTAMTFWITVEVGYFFLCWLIYLASMVHFILFVFGIRWSKHTIDFESIWTAYNLCSYHFFWVHTLITRVYPVVLFLYCFLKSVQLCDFHCFFLSATCRKVWKVILLPKLWKPILECSLSLQFLLWWVSPR